MIAIDWGLLMVECSGDVGKLMCVDREWWDWEVMCEVVEERIGREWAHRCKIKECGVLVEEKGL
ncbi:hypothetical protein, partial [Paenibacillus xylanexedens]|uniref:hypothetical protein n=1 Tax=Paenibacillus xylanexedens TaxID=528191 RepID=UPI001C92FFF1